MAYIPGYEYDIFISYSHVDNEPFPGQEKGWIEQFYENLNLILAKRFGKMGLVKIWWDSKKLDGSILFDQNIQSGINKSAIMICLFSKAYLESDWCKKELDLFYKKAKLEKVGLEVSDRSRIINVLLNNILYTEWPSELSGRTGFTFHDAKEPDNLGDPLETDTKDFRIELYSLRDAIFKLMNEFRGDVSGDHSQHSLSDSINEKEDYTIFMAEVPDTLRTTRKRTILELEKKGLKIVTGIPPPDDIISHDQKVKEELKKSNLSIHLLDNYPGKEIEDSKDLWYPQKQTELALQFGKSQMIWIPAEIEIESIEEEAYGQFLKNLETGKTQNKGYEYIRGSKSTLTQVILDFIEQDKILQQQKQTDKDRISVLLDTHYNDQIYALDLSKILLDNKIQPFINPQEDDPRKNINALSSRISQVRKMIFLYGSVSRDWLIERMSAALQLIITNNFPVEDFYVFMTPPHKEANEISIRQKLLKVNFIDNSNNNALDNVVISKFLTDLKTAAK